MLAREVMRSGDAMSSAEPLSFSHREKVAEGRMRGAAFAWLVRPSPAASRHCSTRRDSLQIDGDILYTLPSEVAGCRGVEVLWTNVNV